MSKNIVKRGRKLTGLLLLLMSVSIVGVSAYVYEQASQTVTQTIVEIANINLNNIGLGNINEGQTLFYTKANETELGEAIQITTTQAGVKLYLNSDLDSQSTYYTTYTLVVKFIVVPSGSSHSVGDTASMLTIASPDPSAITLDMTGTWKFDFEVTTAAKSVSSDALRTVNITVSAESS